MTRKKPLAIVLVGGFFLSMDITYDKPFKTYEQMIALLRSRHIIIENEDFAKQALQNYSYYSLVNGYKYTFLQADGTENFKLGTRFEELYTLHIIDVNLNNILFKYILHIEQALKSRISYLVSEKYGVYTDWKSRNIYKKDDYLYYKNYSSSTNKRESILLKLKESSKNERNHPSLAHYQNNKNHLPPWILIYNIPLGLSIEWYSIMKGVDKTTICEQFLDSPELSIDNRKEFLLKALSLIREYRNKIAHGNRTFSIMQLPTLPKDLTLHYSYGVLSEDEYKSGYGQHDIFAVFLVIFTLLNDKYLLTNFYNDINSIFVPYQETLFNKKTVYEVFGLKNDVIQSMKLIYESKFSPER